MVARGGERNDCVCSDDSEWWSYYKWSSHRIINSFETLETADDRVDWLGRDWEIERDHSDEKLEETVWLAAGFHNWITVCLARIEVFLTVAVGCHVSAVCVMLGCDALIITCHFSFPSHSFTSAIFSCYLLFFLHSRWPEWCFFFSSFWSRSQASHVLQLKLLVTL